MVYPCNPHDPSNVSKEKFTKFILGKDKAFSLFFGVWNPSFSCVVTCPLVNKKNNHVHMVLLSTTMV